MYDFDTVIDRRGTGVSKWAMAPKHIYEGGYIPLTIADMEFKTAPEIQAALHKAVDHGIYGYTYADSEYFEALKAFMLKRRGWEIRHEWFVTTPGVISALNIAVRAFTNSSDAVIIQTPVYPPFKSVVERNGRTLLKNPLIYKGGRYTMDYENLELLCKRADAKLLILCSPHNPVGRVWTYEELKQLGEIAKRNGVMVLSDEIHGELILNGNRHITFSTIDGMEQNCIICTAMSKTFNLAGMCCSNIFIPNAEFMSAFRRRLEGEGVPGIPALSRYAAIAAFREGGAWLDELIKYVEDNFETLYDFIDRRLPMLDYIRAEGTYLAWVDMRRLGMTIEEQEDLMLNKANLALDEGYIFGDEGSGFERINLALPRSELLRALERLENAVYSLAVKEK